MERPNRFIARVVLDGQCDSDEAGLEVKAHVKNTGRCKELLVPGAQVYLEDFTGRMGTRKMRYSLIGVEKVLPDGTKLMVNMDSQAPNKVVAEALADGSIKLPEMDKLRVIKGEKTYGESRFDFYVEDEEGRCGYAEVKGVTLEADGVVRFPDAPTQRGVKHINELVEVKRNGMEAFAIFIIQMEGMKEFRPNDDTHKAFGDALRSAAMEGVHVLAYECRVGEDCLQVCRQIPVKL